MASITTRAGKGSPLTHAEVDANFNNLNNGKLDISTAPAGSVTVDSSGRVGIGTSSPGYALDVVAGSVSAVAARFRGNGGANNNTQIRFYGNNAATDQWAIGGSVATNDTGRDFHIYDLVANTNRFAIDSSGRVGIGTTSPNSKNTTQVTADGDGIRVQYAGIPVVGEGARLIFGHNTNNGTQQIFSAIKSLMIGGGDVTWAGDLAFYTGGSSLSERFRIFNDGSFRFLTPDSVGVGAMKNSRNANGDQVLTLQNGANANNTSSYYLVCQEEAVANRCFIYGNGNIANANNSYGAISDLKLKENIVLASSQWNDIKALQVRKYNFKAETGQPTHTQIGLIAQEVEEVSPGLVYESPDLDAENNDLGTVTKSVNYSVLYMKAVKALQEAMERIETLEAKVAALEASS